MKKNSIIGFKDIVEFSPARDGGVMTRIGGRVAFPDRRAWRGVPAPQPGDEWEVEVSGENPRGTVYFLRPVRRVSTEAERRARAQEERRRKTLHNLSEALYRAVPGGWLVAGRIQVWLDAHGWRVEHFSPFDTPPDYMVRALRREVAEVCSANFPEEWAEAEQMLSGPREEAQKAIARAVHVIAQGEEDSHPWVYEEGGVRGWLARKMAKARDWDARHRASQWAEQVLDDIVTQLRRIRSAVEDLREQIGFADQGEMEIAPGVVVRLRRWTMTEEGFGRRGGTTWQSRHEAVALVVNGFAIPLKDEGWRYTAEPFYTAPHLPKHPALDGGSVDTFRRQIEAAIQTLQTLTEV